MLPESRQSLADARAAAREASELAGPGWQTDRTTALAIERLLMIIGEALIRIRDKEPSVLDAITDAFKVIGMRNVIVHAYDALDPDRVGDALRENVPVLIREIDALLGA